MTTLRRRQCTTPTALKQEPIDLDVHRFALFYLVPIVSGGGHFVLLGPVAPPRGLVIMNSRRLSQSTTV